MAESKIFETKKERGSIDDCAFLVKEFFKNFWEIDLVYNKDSWLDDDFWGELGYDSSNRIEDNDSWLSIVKEESRIELLNKCQILAKDFGSHPFYITIGLHSYDKETVWMKLTGVVVNKEGSAARVFGSAKNITKYKKKRLALEQKVAYYKNVIKGGNFATWEYDFSTELIDVNDRYAEMIGYTTEELQPLTRSLWKTFVHPEDVELIRKTLDDIFHKEEIFEVEYRLKHKKGHWVWILSSGEVTMKSEDNKLQRISGFLYDITARKKNEILLEDYANIIDRVNGVARIGFWEVTFMKEEGAADAVGIWDDNTRAYVGVSKEFVPNYINVLSVIKEGEYREMYINAAANAIKNKVEFDITLPIVDQSNGKEKWVRVIGIPEYTNEGLLRLYGFFQDLDKEITLARSLAIKEEEFRQTFDQASVGMGFVDLENILKKGNESLFKIFGYSKGDGYIPPFQDLIDPQDYQQAISLIHEIIDGKRDFIKEEFRGLTKLGKKIWVQMTLSAVKNDSGELIHMFTQMQDITKEKRTKLKLADFSNLMSRINVVAKIGIWEFNLENNTILWDNNIRRLLGAPEDYNPTTEEELGYYKEGYSRDTVALALNNALNKGTDYSILVEVFAEPQNKYIWTRKTGIVEFENGVCIRLYGFCQDVDKATIISKELAAKEELLRHNFDQAAVGLALINLEGRLEKVNKELCRSTGYSPDEYYNKFSFGDLAHPEDKQKAKLLLSRVLSREVDSAQEEIRFLHKEGYIIWLSIIISTVKDDAGEITHLFSQNQDITDKKRADLKLADFSNLMSRINIAAKIGIWELNIEEETVYWDSTIKRIMGVSQDYKASLQEDIGFFKAGYSQEKIRELLDIALTQGENFDALLEVKSRPRNKYIWTRTTGIVEFKNGKCTRLYGFFQDVDEETRVSKELTVKEEQLRHNFNQAAVGMALVNLEGRLERVNKELSRIVGFSEKELLSFCFGHIAHPEDLKKTQDIFKSIVHKKQDFVKDEFRCIHKNGHIIWVNVVISAVRNDAGELMHLFLQVQNVSENKNLTESLKEHNNRLVNFAHIVSHNLRSHASNISMLLDLVFKDYPLIMENEFLKNIKIVSDNMNDTIYDLNEIVELSSNIRSKLTPQNLLNCIEKSIQNINSSIKEVNAIVEIEVDTCINVLAINAYLESIVLNLITNAVKYRMPNRPLKINILAKKSWDNIILTIEDNGLGIDLARHGDKLFGLYKVFHEHKEAKGVGLFITKNQVEAMGGKIEVTSKVEKGTKFTVYFKKA